MTAEARYPVPPKQLRIWVIGLGTVGEWVLRALHARAGPLADSYDVHISVVGVASARDGFGYDPGGVDLSALLGGGPGRMPIAQLPGVRRWPTAIEGLRATDADVLVEVTGSPAADGEPGLSHLREALGRGIPVVTSNKWPVALYGVELARLARSQGVPLRAESTVMSGTPVLSTLVEGLAGATPIGVRGIMNATVNAILTDMAAGKSYERALADAQQAGLAERDPAADVEGHDAMAKLMIISALVFGRQLRREDVACQGITGITRAEIDDAAASGARIRHVGTLGFAGPGGAGEVSARVAPMPLPGDDLLAAVDGMANAVVCRASPVGEITIVGPGAGPELAGQGVLSDLISVARQSGRN